MTGRAWWSAAAAITAIWGAILGFLLDSGALLILAFFVLLLWVWVVEHDTFGRVHRITRDPEFHLPDRKRLP